jgi:hypothetical protein
MKAAQYQLFLHTLHEPLRVFYVTFATRQLVDKYGLTNFNEKSDCNVRHTGIR